MALKNVACPECGNDISFTIDSDEEIVDIKYGHWGESQKCGNCDTRIGIVLS
jgi:hypothetical protein